MFYIHVYFENAKIKMSSGGTKIREIVQTLTLGDRAPEYGSLNGTCGEKKLDLEVRVNNSDPVKLTICGKL